MSEKQSCGNCRYWNEADIDGGRCGRYPPQNGKWAWTKEEDWCGEWEAKHETASDA